ncbi:MAG: sodium:solute symporter family protein [Lysobacterales bacterium]|jgi:sodium/pantothenate symporter
MNLFAVGMLVSILVYLVVGNYAGRRVKHLEDYFVAGRQAPTLLIVGTLVASLMSTNAFMGESGIAYSGFPAIIILLTAVNCIGYVAGGLWFGRFLRRSRALTLPEYFGHRFDSRRVQTVAGLTVILGCTAYLVMVTQGAATIVSNVTGLPFGATLIIAWLGYTLFTLYSGSRGVILTDTLMFLLFGAVAFVGLSYIVQAGGGWFVTVGKLAAFADKPGIISWHGAAGPDAAWKTPGETLTYAAILGVAWGIVVAVSPWQASRYMMARDEHTVIRSATITAGIVMLLYTVLMFGGAAVNLSRPDIDPAQEVMVWSAMNLLPTFAGVLMVSGILAAGLSSASTFLSLVGFSASNDVFSHRTTDDGRRLRGSRKAMLGMSMAALVLAWALPEGKLFWITYFAGTLFASCWGPVAFLSVWSSRITEAGAFWGILAGLAGNLVTNAVALLGWAELPVILDPILVGAALSYVVTEVVSRRGRVTALERDRRLGLHMAPPEEFEPLRLRRTLAWAVALVVFGVLLTALMIVFYALPYGEAAAGGAGELTLSLAVGLFLVATGALAWWGARRAYGLRGGAGPMICEEHE